MSVLRLTWMISWSKLPAFVAHPLSYVRRFLACFL
jgi:hypothetical protein